MLILMEELGMQIFLWILQLCDGIMELFNSFMGVTPVETADGESGTMVGIVFSNSSINTIFWSIVVLAVGLLAIFTIVAIVRNMIKNDKRISDILGKLLVAVAGTLAVILIVIICMAVVDELIILLADILHLDTSTSFSKAIFDACVPKNGWHTGYSIQDFDVSTAKVSKILGDYKSVAGIWPTSWKGNGMIDPDSFYYVPALIGSCVACVYLFIGIIQLAKRIFEMVYVYLCMPAAMSVLPLDDGARLKNWTQAFTSRMIVIFGCMLSVSVFSLLLPLILSITIPGLGNFANSIFVIVCVIVSAMLITQGPKLFERIFVSREEAIFDGSGRGLMTFYRGVERYERAGPHAVTTTYRAGRTVNGWIDGVKAERSSYMSAQKEGAYREEQLSYLKSIAGMDRSSAADSGTYSEGGKTEGGKSGTKKGDKDA